MDIPEDFKQWVRDEWARLDREKELAKQDACDHYVSGTMKGGVLYCDACGKALTPDDEHYQEERSAVEQRFVESTLEVEG